MATVSEMLAQAWQHHQEGRLPIAEQLYRQILAEDSNHAEAWNLMGVIACQVGNLDAALQCANRAIKSNGAEPTFHNNLGEIQCRLGKFPEGIACFRHALEFDQDNAEAHFNLGNALVGQGQKVEEAIPCYRRALELNPNHPGANLNLGNALRQSGQLEDAIACYRRCVELLPSFAPAHCNLGLALQAHGQLEEAIACYRQAVQFQPGYAEAHHNLGVALQECGQPEDAISSFQWAVQTKPDFVEAYGNLGNGLQELGCVPAAIEAYQRALELAPDTAELHNNLGMALSKQGNDLDAVAAYQRALELKPDYIDAHNNLARAWSDQGQELEAVATYQKTLQLKPDDPFALLELVRQHQHICLWSDLRALDQRVIAAVEKNATRESSGSLAPFSFLGLSTPTTAKQQLQCANQWANQRIRAPRADFQQPISARPRGDKSIIRLGYLSADFHEHATAYLIAELLEKHDRERFAVFAYSYGPDDGSPMRQRLINGVDRFADIKDASFPQAAQFIADDGVDILIDLKGYTRYARTQIAALRPAPVQVNYLGYPGTMGAPFIDYILVDDFVVPSDQQAFFTEKLVHLPGCYQVNDSQRQTAEQTPSRTECGLPESGIVFCGFNNTYKITPDMFDVWMALLKAVPDSVLWLLEGNRFAPDNLRREAHARGVAAERLVFAPRLGLPEHLARHRLADVFLDTFPYNAHTTASDALWMGCPIVTLAGQTFPARVAGSLLRTLGLPELITTSFKDYRDLALRLAQEPKLLADIRSRLEVNRLRCGLFDGARFARHLELAYTTMWEIHTSRDTPRAFAVPA